MKLKASLTVLLVLLATLVAASPAAADPAPGITVTPSTRLAVGTTVSVTGVGLPARTDVAVVECDYLWAAGRDGDLQDCPALVTTTSSADGMLSTQVQVIANTSRRAYGGTYPVYCTQNTCHMFLVWQDSDGNEASVGSGILSYAAPTIASIAADPSSGLANAEQVTVKGKVSSAVGHGVQVREEACFELVQDTGCYGQLPSQASTVKADGSYSITYLAQRFLADDTDCADPDILGSCQLTLVVLDAHGNPDNRYGDSSYGDPGVGISFGGASVTASQTSGLTGGTTVTVTGSRLTPGAHLQVVQCDTWSAAQVNNGGSCPALTTVRASTTGAVSAKVTLVDPAYHIDSNGAKEPVYCRDDECRLFLVATDGDRDPRLEAQTGPLSFTGSSATATAYLRSNLPALKWITLRGTARGAEGRTIKAVEQACYPADAGKACFGQLPIKWGKVKADGTFAVKYPAQRYLGDPAKTDCTRITTGASCRVSIIVLDAKGRHDDSFGVRDLGRPGVEITFAKT